MKTLILFITILATSTSAFASCDSKVKSRVQRELQKNGHHISGHNIQVVHKDKMEIEQGAFLKEMDTYEVEVLGAAMNKFSGLTSETSQGCRVVNLQEIEQLRI